MQKPNDSQIVADSLQLSVDVLNRIVEETQSPLVRKEGTQALAVIARYISSSFQSNVPELEGVPISAIGGEKAGAEGKSPTPKRRKGGK